MTLYIVNKSRGYFRMSFKSSINQSTNQSINQYGIECAENAKKKKKKKKKIVYFTPFPEERIFMGR